MDVLYQIGGLVSFSYDLTPQSQNSSATLLLAFTESPLFIRPFASDDSIIGYPNTTYDGVLTIPFNTLSSGSGSYTMPNVRLRGGYRYLTISVSDLGDETTQRYLFYAIRWMNSDNGYRIELKNIVTILTFSTHMSSLRSYGGYFYAKDPNPPKWSFPGAFEDVSVVTILHFPNQPD